MLDISTFLVSILIAFWLSYRLASSVKILRYTPLLYCLVGILFVLFVLFTHNPPAAKIFERTLQFDVGQNVNIANFSKIPQIS